MPAWHLKRWASDGAELDRADDPADADGGPRSWAGSGDELGPAAMAAALHAAHASADRMAWAAGWPVAARLVLG